MLIFNTIVLQFGTLYSQRFTSRPNAVTGNRFWLVRNDFTAGNSSQKLHKKLG